MKSEVEKREKRSVFVHVIASPASNPCSMFCELALHNLLLALVVADLFTQYIPALDLHYARRSAKYE